MKQMITKPLFSCFRRPAQGMCCRPIVTNLNHHPKQYNSLHQQRTIVGITSNSISTTKIHRHTHQATLDRIHPEHLYRIINDVDKYHQFLPYCTESKVLQSSPCGTMYDAVLRVGLPGLSSSSLVEELYISRVRMTPPSVVEDRMPLWIVEAKSIQSKLFDSLKSRWQLTLADNHYNLHGRGVANQEINTMTNHNAITSSCNVQFEVEIQVSNPLISLMLDQVLKDVARKQVDAFERRGNEIPFRQDRFGIEAM